MQPTIEHIPREAEQSFIYRRFETPNFPFAWHYHPELELTWIISGRGQRYVGDHVEAFEPGDLVLLGSNLPHTWCSQPGAGVSATALVQFATDFPSVMPEMVRVRRLLARAAVGLVFNGSTARVAGEQLEAMHTMSPMQRLTTFLLILDQLSRSQNVRPLASELFNTPTRAREHQRISELHEFIHRHYDEPIRLEDVAAIAKMNPTAFARFFRRKTGRSFVEYLNHLRIAHACRRLIESDEPITDICFLSGFGNLSNFNRLFRRLKGCTPRTYRKRYRETP